MGWTWEAADSDWGVDLDEATGTLKWWGADKPRPGVPAYAQGGGGMDQPVAELLASGRPPYACPAPILAQVRAAADAWARRAPAAPPTPQAPAPPLPSALPPPTPARAAAPAPPQGPLALPAVKLASYEEVLALLRAAAERLGARGLLETPVRRKIAEHVHEPDRPHQTAETEIEWEVDLGAGVRFLLRDRWNSEWSCDDLAGAGPVSLTIIWEALVVYASPRVREALVALWRR